MQSKRRGLRSAGLLALTLGLAVQMLIWGPVAQSQQALAPGDPVDFRGFANGQALFVDALNIPGTSLANTSVAWSGAAVDGGENRLAGLRHQNEMCGPFHTRDANKLTYAMGHPAPVGLGIDPCTIDHQIDLTGRVEADAPPSSTATETFLELPLEPLLTSETAVGTAVANTNDDGILHELCFGDDDLARGLGFVEGLGVLGDLGAELLRLEDPDTGDNVIHSTSRLSLVPTSDPNRFGLQAEVRQIFAPINLADGALVLRVLGEWRLAVTATGEPGGASVEYGRVDGEPITVALEIADNFVLPLEDLAPLTDLLQPLVFVAEGPRALAAPGQVPDSNSQPEIAADGTRASAATDVVRLVVNPSNLLSDVAGIIDNLNEATGGALDALLNPVGGLLGEIEDALQDVLDALPTILELRVGHMEAAVEVPEGGLICDPPPVETPEAVVQVAELPITGTAARQTLAFGGALALGATGLGFLIRRRRAGI